MCQAPSIVKRQRFCTFKSGTERIGVFWSCLPTDLHITSNQARASVSVDTQEWVIWVTEWVVSSTVFSKPSNPSLNRKLAMNTWMGGSSQRHNLRPNHIGASHCQAG